ncbi:putative NADH dehydrogenase [ubiquinone] complex I, assembly factor 7 -like protein [Capsicum annuum]|nr:putative NADH dehydrogenase [ubiquinone] complex I, assembly factor 7 -like protein [Capsicum annuum]
MYSGLGMERNGGMGEYHNHHFHHNLQSSITGEMNNLVGDACLVLTADHRPRLRWTAELHERFVDAVTQLGGPDRPNPRPLVKGGAVPSTAPQPMLVSNRGDTENNYEGNGGERTHPISFEVTPADLELFIFYMSLQKYRLGKQSKEAAENYKDESCMAESQDTSSTASGSSKVVAQDINDCGYQVTEAFRVQMEVQRRLQEQLEVQRHVQLRIEAQGKYLQTILEKACKALNYTALESPELDTAREQLSELAIKGANANNCDGIVAVPSLPEVVTSFENQNASDMPATSLVSPTSIGVLKKRPRPLANGDALPVEDNMTPVQWMMTNS